MNGGRYAYQADGERAEVLLEALSDGRWRASVDGRVYHLRADPVADGGWQLKLDGGGAAVTAYCARQADARYMWLRGQVIELQVDDGRSTSSARGARARAGERSAGGALGVTAIMPGQVREVLVAVGDVVTRGQALLLLEAMKMEIRVTAPSDGVVKALLAAQGDVVERGQSLVELDGGG